jgi:putative Mg2+ transporter-C (MgtC) family protein
MERFLANIIICFILSFFIGLERQWQRRITGLRTNVLVSIGSFLFVSVATLNLFDGDTTRMATQVVTGIGFLGAGVILKDGTHIKGLNTAATLWCNAAIGCLCAYGYTNEAIIGTGFVLLSNILLRALGIKLLDRNVQNDYSYLLELSVSPKNAIEYRKKIKSWLEKTTMNIDSLDVIETKENTKLQYLIDSRNSVEIEKMVNMLSVDEKVNSVSWKIIDEDIRKMVENDDV